MTHELNILLQRILPQLKEPQTDQQPSRNLTVLLTRVEQRKWKEATEAELAQQLETLRDELTFIKHLLNCEQCMLEQQLSVERYLGTRGPWYLNLMDEDPDIYDDGEDPIYKDYPRHQDYEIGYYGHENSDTLRFIRDRSLWAEGVLTKEVEAANTFLAALKDWDLTSPRPSCNSLFFWGFT